LDILRKKTNKHSHCKNGGENIMKDFYAPYFAIKESKIGSVGHVVYLLKRNLPKMNYQAKRQIGTFLSVITSKG